MGGFRSGRHRDKRAQVEDAARLDARKHGAGLVRQTVAGTDAVREMGLCPQCRRPVRWLYKPQGEEAACRLCHGLIYRSKAENSTIADKVRKAPQLICIALDDAEQWLEGVRQGHSDAGKLSNAMNIISAANSANIVPDAPTKAAPLSSETFDGLNVPDDATLQERVIAQDVTRATAMIERIESLIEGGQENHVNRMGEVQRVPMRVDSLAKLGHLWVALSNLRAARSGVATQITEARTKVEERRVDVMQIISDPASVEAVHILTERMAQLARTSEQPEPK